MTDSPSLAPFVPRRARLAGVAIGALWAGGWAYLLWSAPGAAWIRGLPAGSSAGYAPTDVIPSVLVAVAGVVLLWRIAGVRADPTMQGIRVRDVVRVRTVAWPQVVGVRIGPGDPWPLLDLADGTTLAIMGLQRADGPRWEAELERLRTMVALWGTAPEPDR